MVRHKYFLIIFGGASNYVSEIKSRICLNDIKIFDTSTEKWVGHHKPMSGKNLPLKRRGQASCSWGPVMLIHGGISFEQKSLLNDFSFYDIEENHWIVDACVEPFGELNKKSHMSLLKYKPEPVKMIDKIGVRAGHTMTSIHTYYNSLK
jgi:hypothetical protein